MDDYISIGTDIIEVKRFKNFDYKGGFAKKVFTREELKECKSKKKSIESLAGRFAAKEAIKKTIEEKIDFNMIQVLNDKTGRPKVTFLNSQINNKYHSKLSISHTSKLAQAVCITIKNT